MMIQPIAYRLCFALVSLLLTLHVAQGATDAQSHATRYITTPPTSMKQGSTYIPPSVTTVAVTSQSTNITQPKDILCINAYGVCLSRDSQACSEKHAAVPGICGAGDMICCVPSQAIEATWFKDDGACTDGFGTCQIDTAACADAYDESSCGGPEHRRCCSPSNETIDSWKKKDDICLQGMGTCQLSSKKCEGSYQSTCGGPDNRQCCLPSAEILLKWEADDGGCRKLWGSCQSDQSKCTGGKFISDLCGGPSSRQCCVPTNKTVDSWKDKDADCLLKYGVCQLETVSCNGTLSKDLCSGPKYRQCCSPSDDETTRWASNDGSCVAEGGKCQHNQVACEGGKYMTNVVCGGPLERQCCIKPGNAPSGSSGSNSAPGSNTNGSGPVFLSKRNMVLIIGGIVTLVLLISLVALLCRRCCSFRSYKRVKDDNWDFRNSGEPEESLNLTSCEEKINYA